MCVCGGSCVRVVNKRNEYIVDSMCILLGRCTVGMCCCVLV